MSNILYRVQMAPQEEAKTCVIDSNKLVDEKIEKRRREEKKRQLHQMAAEDAFVPMDGENLEEEEANLGEALPEEVEPEEPQIDYVAEAKAQADAILADANLTAENILASKMRLRYQVVSGCSQAPWPQQMTAFWLRNSCM